MCYWQSNMICFVFKIVATLLFSSLTYGVISFCRQYPDDITALKMADLYFTQASLEGSTEVTSEDSLLQVYSLLEKNLFSPYSKVCPCLSEVWFCIFSCLLRQRNPEIFGGPSDESVCLGVAILICLRPLLVIHISFVTFTVQWLTLENWNVLDYDIILVHTYFAG